MGREEWQDLSMLMAAEAIAMDMAELFIPILEGREKAKNALKVNQQKAMEVLFRMGQALIVLEKMGYVVQKKGGKP